MAVWPSWPHACITPGVLDVKGVSRISVGEGVDVGAPADGAPGPVAAQDADHPGAGDARAHLELGGVEPLGDDLRRSPLLEGQLGVTVKVAAQRDQRIVTAADLLAPRRTGLVHGNALLAGLPMLPRRTGDGHAAVHRQGDARDVARLVGDEEEAA